MELSNEQSNALSAIAHHDFSRPFFLGGYAGTGKTTILKRLLEDYGPDKILFLAPTGKACQVLKSKMPEADVRTIHSALYSAHEISEEAIEKLRLDAEKGDEEAKRLYEFYTKPEALRVRFQLNPCSELVYNLVIVDEASMVGEKEFNNLISVARKIVFVGDPAQLPPVESASILPTKFDAFLTTVHRQAKESPVIRLSMSLRNNEAINWNYWGKEGIELVEHYSAKHFYSFDQIIAPMRATKGAVNKAMRKSMGRMDKNPCITDKIIVRQNVKRGEESYLVNGDIGTVVRNANGWLDTKFAYEHCPVRGFFMCDEELARTYGVTSEFPRQKHSVRIDYAYAITVHSSQGSEWPRVLLCDDGMWLNNREGRAKLMYTAITRAKEHLGVFLIGRK